MLRGPALLLAVLALVAALAAPAGAAASTVTIRLTDRVTPADVTVAPGTTVVFRNDSGNRHRMRSVDHSGDEGFDTGNLEPGESAAVTLAAEGTYAFVDDRDRDDRAFHGTITVRASGGGAAPGGSAPGFGSPDPGAGGGTPPGGGTAPGGGSSQPGTAAPASAAVSIVDDDFTPRTVEIRAGGTVTWVNRGGDEHTASARDGSWSSGVQSPGGRYSRTFASAGTYAYLCLIHTDMQATVVVRAPGAAPDQPAAPAAPPAPAPTPRPDSTSAPDSTPAAPGAVGPASVAISDTGFAPNPVTVAVGARVTWTNAGIALHTVTATDGGFDSGFRWAGDTWTYTASAPGRWAYACALHPSMVGTLQVIDPPADGVAGPSPTTPPTARPSGDATARPSASVPASAPASSLPALEAGAGGGQGDGQARTQGDPARLARATGVDGGSLVRLVLVALLVVGATAVFGRAVRGQVAGR